MVPIITALVLDIFSVISDVGFWYFAIVGYSFVSAGTMLMSTLDPKTFDFDRAMDKRPAARRVVTVGLLLAMASTSLQFPYFSTGFCACYFMVKLVWDELVVGSCSHPRKFSRYRPLLSDVICIGFCGTGFQYGLNYWLQVAPCHAAAAANTPEFNASMPAGNSSATGMSVVQACTTHER
jgi:hypothetical protein